MTGRRISRALLAGAALLAVSAGCGVRPSAAIPGAPAPAERPDGVGFYLVLNGKLMPVLRPTGQQSALALLAAGPNAEERAQGFTTEIPPDAAPIELAHDSPSMVVTLSTDVAGLSTMAVDQIVCTAIIDTPGRASGLGSVTLVGHGRSRGPQTCPLFA
ncbi:hypothetical protein MOQ72_38700 [Saccharopolyspora sp. K220]|uniref:hypothetical protein n=1 Tax=Saccharopolyspora soli TaxID=2926618 RepID=UPI001F55B95D|nr:hypothetical protein [Saccharopolyspora soli]MCI2423366.1 hypothetical protein [Saccharopolyspora soli]